MSASPHERFGAIGFVIAIAAVAALSSAFLVGSTPDEEEFRFAVLSAWLHVRALWSGDYALWTPLLGLGIPQPFVPNFTLHPLAPVLGAISPVDWVRLLLFTHTVAGAVGMWCLGSMLQLSRLVRGVSVATFLLASPVQNYVLTDFWPSHYIVWTAVPWLLVFAWRLLDPATTNPRRWAALLGLTTGLVGANANLAYLAVWAPLVVTVLVGHWRLALTRLHWVAAAGVIALAVVAPTAVQIVTQRAWFTDAELSNVMDPLPWSATWTAVIAPFGAAVSSRSLFFGGPFAVLALAGAVAFARTRFDLVSGAGASAVLLFTTWVPLPFVSQRYQFRDVLTFCAIPLAALAANRLLRSGRAAPLAMAALVLQVGVVAWGASPLIARTLEPEWRWATSFRGATADAPLADSLVEQMIHPGRLLYSPGVESQVSDHALDPDGLGINTLAYRGIAVVNGSFKAVSADSLWPDDRLFYGRVRTPDALMTSAASLDVLGIRYVLAHPDELVAPDLRPLVAVTSVRNINLVLYENRDALPGVFLLPPAAADRDLPVYDGCGNDRLLCRDLVSLADQRLGGPITIERGPDEFHISGNRLQTPAMLVVMEMFRPEWSATAGERRLTPRAVYGGLIGVPLPAGVTEVRLVYQPAAQYWATVACAIAVLAAIGLIARRASPAAPPTPTSRAAES